MDSPRHSPYLDYAQQQSDNTASCDRAKNRIITCLCGGIRAPMIAEIETMRLDAVTADWILRASDELLERVTTDAETYAQNMGHAQYVQFVADEVARATMQKELCEWVQECVRDETRDRLIQGPLQMTLPMRLRQPDADAAVLSLSAETLVCQVGNRLRVVISS